MSDGLINSIIGQHLWLCGAFVSLVILFYHIIRIYYNNPNRFFTLEKGKMRFDYNLIYHIIFNAIIFGGSIGVSLGLMYFGFLGYWPNDFNYQMGQGAIIFSAIIFLIFSWSLIDEYILNRIEEILSELDAKIEMEQAFKEELEKLKKGLMQVLLTGKVRVKV